MSTLTQLSALPNTNSTAAPSAAPAEVPTRSGSTMGLRNRACISVPDMASVMPTAAHSSTRGRRMWKNAARRLVSAACRNSCCRHRATGYNPARL